MRQLGLVASRHLCTRTLTSFRAGSPGLSSETPPELTGPTSPLPHPRLLRRLRQPRHLRGQRRQRLALRGLRGAHLVFDRAVERVRKARVIAAQKKAVARPWAVPSDQLPPVVWPAKTATSIRVDSHGNKINHLGQKVGYDGVLLE